MSQSRLTGTGYKKIGKQYPMIIKLGKLEDLFEKIYKNGPDKNYTGRELMSMYEEACKK